MGVQLSIIGRILLVLAAVFAAGGQVRGAAYAASEVDPNDLSFYRPSITTASYPLAGAERVCNVILCIGDGMGVNQVALANLKTNSVGGRLHMERLPVAGLVWTYSADSLVTDSAAAATALACGVKTNNGMVGMTPDEQSWCTVRELAQAKGMATGLVVTSSITDATPASFAAHVKSRKMEDRIAELLIVSQMNVVFGGGRKFFLPQSDPKSGRKDDRDLIAQAKQADYMVIATATGLQSIRYPRMLGLFQLETLTTVAPEPSLALLTETAIDVLRHVPTSADRPAHNSAMVVGPDPTVAMLSAKAIDLLDHANRNSAGARSGFFLMVEGSQID
jgi:alkaline phosphatase